MSSPDVSTARLALGRRRRGWAAAVSLVLLVVASLLMNSCGGLALTVANAPAVFGDFERHAAVAYGVQPRQLLDVYKPSQALRRPIVIFWYGGAWTRGSRTSYRFVGAALAEAGYVAVLPDYRLYPQVKFPDFVHDGALAAAWVARHAAQFGGDPNNIFLAGHSAGAHTAALLAYDRRYLQQAGFGGGMIRGLIGLSGPYALAPNTTTLKTIFAAPYTPRDWQPVQFAATGAPPALLLHGAADSVVWVSHAEALAAALADAKVPVALQIYPERAHADTVAALSLAARGRAPVLADMRRFIDATALR
jgi:acetyl esterase/lipase